MDYTTLGRTGLKVSRAGLGAGGGSRMGRTIGLSAEQSAALIRLAYELGINVIDTAEDYGTEEIVGLALKDLPRDQVVVSTKHYIIKRGHEYSTQDVLDGLDNSLRALGTDYVDLFFVHGLTLRSLPRAVGDVIPALKREQEKGKFRFLGATEAPPQDLRHDMARQVMDEDLIDVLMPAFSVLNQNARQFTFPMTNENNIGTYLMFVVRNMFAFPEHTWATFRNLADQGKLPAELAGDLRYLDFLIRPGGARDLLDVAYRYARDEPGVDVVLFGTGHEDHLRHNVESLTGPPLPDADRQILTELLGALEGVGLEPSQLSS